MVKELDLFESNHGCGLNARPTQNIRRNIPLHGPELVRNVVPRPSDRVVLSTHGFSTFEYFYLTSTRTSWEFERHFHEMGVNRAVSEDLDATVQYQSGSLTAR
jgi:hypothetical protein